MVPRPRDRSTTGHGTSGGWLVRTPRLRPVRPHSRKPICAICTGAGFADDVGLPARMLRPRPRGLSWEESAAFPLTFATKHASRLTRGASRSPSSTAVHHGAPTSRTGPVFPWPSCATTPTPTFGRFTGRIATAAGTATKTPTQVPSTRFSTRSTKIPSASSGANQRSRSPAPLRATSCKLEL